MGLGELVSSARPLLHVSFHTCPHFFVLSDVGSCIIYSNVRRYQLEYFIRFSVVSDTRTCVPATMAIVCDVKYMGVAVDA